MRFSFFYFGLAALFVIGCSQERDDGVIYRTLGMHTGPFNFNQPSIVSWSTASNQSSKPVIVIKTNYVVHRDVPNKPDITVIPLKYHNYYDVRLCTAIERRLIEMGIAVINPPPEHQETVTRGQETSSTEVTPDGSKSKNNGDSIEMRFSCVRDIKSTFAIIADGSTHDIRVLRMDNQQIVAIIQYNAESTDANNNTGIEPERDQSFRTLIEALGFNPKIPARKNNSLP
jgi:hypothetical protein